MKILFEEYPYDPNQLKGVLSHHFYNSVSQTSKKKKINYVGYYCRESANGTLEEPIMIFPKVFLKYDANGKNPKAFGYFKPDSIIDVLEDEKLNQLGEQSITRPLLYEMSVWLFRAIDKYRKSCDKESISEAGSVNPVISRKDNHSLTELEIIEALRLFYEENRNLFTFISRMSNSQKHRIKWSQTIARKTPVFVDYKPVYFDVYSKKKTIDYDEELIRMFFSVLNHLNGKYGFGFKMNINFDLITGSEYRKLERKGYRYLKTIRYRYFNDKMLKLHELLSLYFERISRSRVGKAEEEYVLIKDFNRVFEEMIDHLIGDRAEGEIKKMKSQPDNKQLDHIYRESGVFKKEDIYFIADSKYYSDKTTVDPYSSYKQFTYARNVLALSLDLFRKGSGTDQLNYQDKLTDGYHPSPNFFISAFFDDRLKLTDTGLTKEEKDFVKRSAHWDNRLFDRDTMFTLSYRINFMFALQTFVRRNSRLKMFKKETRAKFRKEFIRFLDSRYIFYCLTPKTDFKEAIDNHFKLLLGVSFCPAEEKQELILALEKDEANDGKEKDHRGLKANKLKQELRHDWNITKTGLKEYERANRGEA